MVSQKRKSNSPRFVRPKGWLQELGTRRRFLTPEERTRFLSKPAVRRWVEKLHPNKQRAVSLLLSTDPNIRHGAIYELTRGGAKEAIPFLEVMALDQVPMVRVAAVSGLGFLESRESSPLLQARLKDPAKRVRENAIHALGHAGTKKSIPMLEQLHRERSQNVRYAAITALNTLDPTNPRYHALYERQLRTADTEFFDSRRRIVRRKFRKTGSSTTLLGGSSVGKAIIRIVRPEAFEAWKAALTAGIPVEPILKRKDGRLRARKPRGKTSWRVVSKVLGPNLDDFFSTPINRGRYKKEITRQWKNIHMRLKRRGISHGHLHNANFCVQWEKSGGKRVPKLYLIDFDQAFTAQEN